MHGYVKKIKYSDHIGEQEINSYLKNKQFLEEVVVDLEEVRSEDKTTKEGSTWKKEQHDQKH